MSLQKIIEWDRKNLERLRRVQLPNGYKKIGLAVVILSFVALVIHKAADIDIDWLRQLIKNVLLIGLLMISIAREKVEDEMIASIRMQSYAMSFIIGVVYGVVQPYVNYGVGMLLGDTDANLQMGYVQVLSFMLIVQILFFRVMLKKCRV